MSHEFYYTSAPRGLVKGSRGYCAVAMTKGLPPFLAERLEDYSGYKPLFSALDPRNPVNVAYYRLDLGAQTYYILTRVAASGLDYTERTNKFAHHVVLTAAELPAAGPAWLARQPGFLETEWDGGEPRWLPTGRSVPQGQMPPRICAAWTKAAGDAGWAGVLAECALAMPMRPALVLYEPGTDVLALFAEALALLPEKLRWRVTFSTYASSLPPGESCVWRGLAKGSPEAAAGPHLHGAEVITLSPTMGQARGGALVDAARTGATPRMGSVVDDEEPPSGAWQSQAPRRSAVNEDFDDPNMAMGQISLESLQPAEDEPEREAARVATPRRTPALSGSWKMQTACLGLGALLGAALLLVGELLSEAALADWVRAPAPSAHSADGEKKDKQIEDLLAANKKLESRLSELKPDHSGDDTTVQALRGQLSQRLIELQRLGADLASEKAGVRKMEMERSQLKSQLASKDEEIERKAIELAAVKKELGDLKREVAKRPGKPRAQPNEPELFALPLHLPPPKELAKKQMIKLTDLEPEVSLAFFAQSRAEHLSWSVDDERKKLVFYFDLGKETRVAILELYLESHKSLAYRFTRDYRAVQLPESQRGAQAALERTTVIIRSDADKNREKHYRFAFE